MLPHARKHDQMKHRTLLILSVCLLFLFLPGAIQAQTTISTGSVQGTITDPSGAVVPKANISITGRATDQVTAFAAHVAVSGPSDIPYPTGFRRWAHVKTVLVGPQSPFFQDSGGIHHIYANEKAMEGYSTGKFLDGSILIFDLLATKEKDGVIAEGARQRVDVMLKDSKRFSSTGGWGFERFLGDSETDRPLTEEHRKLCFTCHEQAKEHDFVFSVYRK